MAKFGLENPVTLRSRDYRLERDVAKLGLLKRKEIYKDKTAAWVAVGRRRRWRAPRAPRAPTGGYLRCSRAEVRQKLPKGGGVWGQPPVKEACRGRKGTKGTKGRGTAAAANPVSRGEAPDMSSPQDKQDRQGGDNWNRGNLVCNGYAVALPRRRVRHSDSEFGRRMAPNRITLPDPVPKAADQQSFSGIIAPWR